MSQERAEGGADIGEPRWAFETGDPIWSSPTVADGTVYVGSDDSHLYAVDATTGDPRWRFETGGGIQTSPTVVDGTVYVGSSDGHLYAVAADDGTEQWAFETGYRIESSPTVVDGTVYVGSWDEHLYAVDVTTGAEAWAFETGGEISASPAVVGDTVYVGSWDEHLYAVDGTTGTERWAFETNGYVSSPAVVDGTVYVGNNSPTDTSYLYAVDAAIGTERWRLETGSAVVSSPAVAEGTVYVGSDGGTLYAVAADDGTAQWTLETGGWVHSSPAVADGTVYVGSSDSHLYAVAADDGSEQWTVETEGSVESSPVVMDGTVYVGSGDGHLYAVAASAERELAGGRTQRATDATAVPSGDGSPAGLEGLQGPADAPIPSPETVASPPRRDDLSYDAMTVGEELGAGGQAAIRKARLAEGPPEVVALREPDASATLTREAAETFSSRAETWATVDAHEREKQRWTDHEHIVGVVAAGERHPWLAMEYMDGGNLGEVLAEYPDGLPLARALWYGECVCKGLEIAHSLGRAHLDVKPENVLLKETGGWAWPKIADWGLSRTLADEPGTVDGLSAEYAAPEQFDPAAFGDPDQLTDVYQAGALVYALLTGAPPTTGSRIEVMQTVTEDAVAPPSERRSELPAAVDAAVGVAVERDKTERYSSISSFADALRAIRTGGRLPAAVVTRSND